MVCVSWVPNLLVWYGRMPLPFGKILPVSGRTTINTCQFGVIRLFGIPHGRAEVRPESALILLRLPDLLLRVPQIALRQLPCTNDRPAWVHGRRCVSQNGHRKSDSRAVRRLPYPYRQHRLPEGYRLRRPCPPARLSRHQRAAHPHFLRRFWNWANQSR